MNNQFLVDSDIDLAPLLARKVAIIGYGSQGRSHALNLRDSGITVVVGQRDGQGYEQARNDGFEPTSISEAARSCSLVCIMLPDEIHGELFDNSIRSQLVAGDIVLTCHGFSLHYGLVVPPPKVAAILVAPKAAGHRVRSAFEEGQGVPCLVAPGPNAETASMDVGLAYAKAIGGGRSGILPTTVAEETETDLFGEQAVLCGGVSALIKAGFETLVDAGYQPEVAYFECVHELKLVVDLLHRGGLAFMRDHISNTAEYGDYTRGPRLIGEGVRQAMADILGEIQSGEFAREWIEENRQSGRHFRQMRRQELELLIEQTGKRIIALNRE